MKLLLVIILFLVYFHYIGNYIYQVFNKYLYWNKFKFPIGFYNDDWDDSACLIHDDDLHDS